MKNTIKLAFKKVSSTDPPTKGILAVSGGLDSVVLAHLFKLEAIPFSIAHCNFQLRGSESDTDAQFVSELADSMGVSCYMTQFETKSYAEEHGISTQMAARILRYQWFESLALEHSAEWIATAHHLNDQVETTLLNFARGTGLPGLTGMRENTPLPYAQHSTHLVLLRPLLTTTRAELETFATAHNIVWREDSSNHSDHYQRNYIRHHLVPHFQALNNNFIHTVSRNIHRLQSTDENLGFLLNHYLKFDESTNQIDTVLLKALPAPDQALHLLLHKHGFTEDQSRQAAAHLSDGQLDIVSDTGCRLLIHQKVIQIISNQPKLKAIALQIHENDLMVRLPNQENLFLIHSEPLPPFPDGKDSIIIDAALVKYPLTWRNWQSGDAFQPFGMGGKHQKLQDFFTNLKLSPLEKEEIRILVNGDDTIIWVLGYRSSEAYKITSKTVKALKIVRG